MRRIGLAALFVSLALVASGSDARKPATSWASDNGNGTYSNPLFYDEFSDPDMIRVGSDYYLTGTTMHTMPGLPILHSRDLVNWRIIGYAFDRLGPQFPPFELNPPDLSERRSLDLHQGGIVDTPSGEWWGFSMQDHNSVGRLTLFIPGHLGGWLALFRPAQGGRDQADHRGARSMIQNRAPSAPSGV